MDQIILALADADFLTSWSLELRAEDRQMLRTLMVSLLISEAAFGTTEAGRLLSDEEVSLPRARRCESGHFVLDNSYGEVIELEDGTVWEVASYESYTSLTWRTGDHIAVCGDKLFNVDERETG
jgi:hypothetical protein